MMDTLVSESPDWASEDWPVPPKLPRIQHKDNIWICKFVSPFPYGVRIPRHIKEDKLLQIFKRLWYTYDTRSWHIQPFERDDWYIEIRNNIWNYLTYIQHDSTPRLYAHLDSMKILGGGHLVICGHPGSGKSILGQMLGERLLPDPKHVVFESTDIEKVIEGKEESDLCIIIDESLEHTGTGSASSRIHDGNIWASGRKGLMWGIQVGTNADHREYSNTTALVMKPCGIDLNTWRWIKFLKDKGKMPTGPIFQATRFAMYRNSNFLGWAVMQRKHRPTDILYYENDPGTYSTYKARARAYSMLIRATSGATGAVNPIMEEKHILTMKDYLKQWCEDEHEEKPPDDEMCITLYGKANLPQKYVAYVKRIIKWAKYRLKKEKQEKQKRKGKTAALISAKGWDFLRETYDQWGQRPYTMYKIPPFPRMTWQEVADALGEPVDGESLRKRTSRRLSGRSEFPPSTKELGNIGERFVLASLPDEPAARIMGNAGEIDISCRHPDGHALAISVKYTEKERFRERDNHPEHAYYPYCVAVLVIPRLLELRVFHITQTPQTLNSKQGTICSPQSLWKTILQVLEDAAGIATATASTSMVTSSNDTEEK